MFMSEPDLGAGAFPGCGGGLVAVACGADVADGAAGAGAAAGSFQGGPEGEESYEAQRGIENIQRNVPSYRFIRQV
jgi:hypothetical protein